MNDIGGVIVHEFLGNELEVALRGPARLGEGPVWDAVSERLLWIDLLEGIVHRFDPTTGTDVNMHLDQAVGFVAPATDGGAIVGLRDGLALIDSSWSGCTVLVDVDRDDTSMRFNDGSCDARGRLFAGTMAFDGATDRGALYRFAAGHLDMVLSPVSVSNGLDWSPDNSTMYYVDSALQRIDRIDYDLDTGELGQRSPFVVVATEDGIPDGLCVDAAGYVWVAFVAGWCVRRFDPTGQLDLVVRLPVANVTACAFGGPTLEDLYITTASDGLDGEERERQPLAGALFRLRAPVSGRAGYHFDSSSLMSR